MSEDNTALVKEFALRLNGAKFWMYLLGILMIIGGVLEALSIVGIVVAWLPIWLGVLLCMAASALGQASLSGATEQFNLVMGRLKLYFIIQGVMVLIGILVGLIAFMFFGSFILGMLAGHHM